MNNNTVATNNSSEGYDDVILITNPEVYEMKESPCYETIKYAPRNTEIPSTTDSKKNLVCTLIAIMIIIAFISTCACLAFALIEIFRLRSEMVNIQQQLSSTYSSVDELSQESDQLKHKIESNTKLLNSSINMFHHKLRKEIESESQQLNSSINMFHHQLSKEIESESQQLNSSINMFHHKLSQEIESESQTLNSSINMFHHQLHQEIENESQQLNSSINMFHHQLSQEIENEIKQLNSSINSWLNEKCPALENYTEHLTTALENIGQYQNYPADSCAAILLCNPFSPSGNYWVTSSNGSAVSVYCDMTRSCGNITGGWMRVLKLDMTNSSTQCPSGLRQHTDSNIRICAINSTSEGCSSVTLFTSTIQFSRVCGIIKAYQFGPTDAFGNNLDDIESYYVDGVSLTHGERPRQHIWTFAAARDETEFSPQAKCPCTNIYTTNFATSPPAFVGNDYFCDTGSSDSNTNNIIYSDDPLWDGAGCGPLNTCCSFNNPPWFYKQLSQATTDDIEMRICRSDPTGNEDIGIEMIDIYIQ